MEKFDKIWGTYHLGVHTENFWIIVAHSSGGKFLGSDKNCGGRIWGEAPDLKLWKWTQVIELFSLISEHRL